VERKNLLINIYNIYEKKKTMITLDDVYLYVDLKKCIVFGITNFIFKKLQNKEDIGNDRLQEKEKRREVNMVIDLAYC